jgi:general stress protein 26
MNKVSWRVAAAVFGVLTLAGCAANSATAPIAPHDNTWLAAARRMMIETRYCALITIGTDGQPQARTIDPSPPDERMVVTFATNPATRKVRQIERDPRVTLYYFDPVSPGYVTVIGTARLATQKRWLEKWTPFYPGGAGGALVYEVTPVRIEVVDVARGIMGDATTWKPPSIEMNSGIE